MPNMIEQTLFISEEDFNWITKVLKQLRFFAFMNDPSTLKALDKLLHNKYLEASIELQSLYLKGYVPIAILHSIAGDKIWIYFNYDKSSDERKDHILTCQAKQKEK